MARVLFALGVSVLTGILFGVAPAWTTSHADPVEALRGAHRSVHGRPSQVIGQAAMSIVLLSAAALLGKSLRNLERQSFGFATEGRYLVYPVTFCFRTKTVAVDGKTSRRNCPIPWQRSFPFNNPLLFVIPSVLGFPAALLSPAAPDVVLSKRTTRSRPKPQLSTGNPGKPTCPGVPWRDLQCAIRVPKFIVLQPPSLCHLGDDAATIRPVGVVNEAFARRFFKNENPLGKHFGPDKIQYASRYEIVGVVKDMRYMAYHYRRA